MPLERGSATHLRDLMNADKLVERLREQFNHQLTYHPSLAEIRSWERSLPVVMQDLHEAGLGAVEVLIEHRLPYTTKRVDLVLCGFHPRTGDPSYVVVELKQWTYAQPLDDSDDVIVLDLAGSQKRLHPVDQVARYCDYILDYVANLSESPESVAGVAYLHNAQEGGVAGLGQVSYGLKGQMFTQDRRAAFLDFLKRRLAPGSGVDAADHFLGSALRPSKKLMALAAEEVQRREQFRLLDEQQVAYSLVNRAVEKARSANTKEVLIVKGGPGSGKSVIALSLLGELSRQGRSVLHATGSSAFTQTLRRVAGARAPRVKTMFTYYNQFMQAEKNGLEVLINDEAHRIKKTSTNRFTPATKRTGRPQVDELIDAARVPVFLLDEHQVVRPHEIGTVADIQEAAARLGCTSTVVDLDVQFRCGGSRAYEKWVLHLLGLEGDQPVEWEPDGNFDLRISDGPSEMEARLLAYMDTNHPAKPTSRIAAGYCWEWSRPGSNSLPLDVVIGEWRRPWNNPKDTKVGEAPGRPFWAIDPEGFGQVGCIYTAQGFEYDYSGVIFGPDLVWRSGAWVARPEYSRDNQVRRAGPEEFDRAIRNTYKVLLTRGMKGAVVFSTDAETQALFRSLIP